MATYICTCLSALSALKLNDKNVPRLLHSNEQTRVKKAKRNERYVSTQIIIPSNFSVCTLSEIENIVWFLPPQL